MSNPLLVVRDLSVTYSGTRQPAVANVNFEIEAATCLAIVGESGSGKSTTALAITQLLEPSARSTAEEILFEGINLTTASKLQLRAIRRDRLGTVFQDPVASWNLSRKVGVQLLDAFPRNQRDSMHHKLIEYMESVGIDKAEQRVESYPYMLSGGMMQRAMIAGALLGNPALLIADEPTSALDVTVQADLLYLLSELRREHGLAILLVSHNLGVVSQVAERTLVMYSGKVVEEGPTKSLIESPKHPYTVNLVRSMPNMKQIRKTALYTNEVHNVSSSGCVYANRCPLVIPLCRNEKPELVLLEGTKVACHRASDAPNLLEVRIEPIA
jgi:oligopeptide/dipeptide ABC transporter ATP-binding protein